MGPDVHRDPCPRSDEHGQIPMYIGTHATARDPSFMLCRTMGRADSMTPGGIHPTAGSRATATDGIRAALFAYGRLDGHNPPRFRTPAMRTISY